MNMPVFLMVLIAAVIVLVGDDVIHVAHHFGLERCVVQEKGQRDQAVQPVGSALPALAVAAEPAAVADVGPELVQVPAQPVGLDAQLPRQPAPGPDVAQG